jgi:hypothetical protein
MLSPVQRNASVSSSHSAAISSNTMTVKKTSKEQEIGRNQNIWTVYG